MGDNQMTSDRTRIVWGPKRSRTVARWKERQVQSGLKAGGGYFSQASVSGEDDTMTIAGVVLPAWARGVRVEPTPNGKQHVLVATEHTGH
jgi:hypothetical protein